jgi:hypothetical protein
MIVTLAAAGAGAALLGNKQAYAAETSASDTRPKSNFVSAWEPGLITGAAGDVSRKIHGVHENERSSRKLQQRP